MKSTARVWSGMLVGASAVIMVVVSMASPAAAGDGPSLQQVLANRIAAGDLEYRDAETGEVVVATAERVAEIRESLAPQFAPVSGVHRYEKADGTIQISAEQPFRDVYLVRVNLDGTRTRGCFRDLDAAVAFVVRLDATMEQSTDPTRTASVD